MKPGLLSQRSARVTNRANLLLVTAALSLGLIGCRHPEARPNQAENHARHDSGLELNHGRKWVVVPTMMVHLRNIEKEVSVFETSSSRDHAALANGIQDHLGRLVTNCTMEGKAHDELHKWLMPFLGLSADYAKASDPDVQAQKLGEIKQALLVFNQYFE